MPDIVVNFIKPSFYFFSHDTNFVSTSSSHNAFSESRRDSDAVGDIKMGRASFSITINQLEPGYRVLKPIPLTIEQSGDGFIASFEAANIHSAGESFIEAAQNLKSLILDIFDSLMAESPDKLGPGPKRQLSALLQYAQTHHS